MDEACSVQSAVVVGVVMLISVMRIKVRKLPLRNQCREWTDPVQFVYSSQNVTEGHE